MPYWLHFRLIFSLRIRIIAAEVDMGVYCKFCIYPAISARSRSWAVIVIREHGRR
jgi:hypothetical protein